MCAKIADHPRLAEFLSVRLHYVATTSLGMFGGDSAKPLKLWSSSDFVEHLQRRLIRTQVPRSTTTKVTTGKNGKRRFTGTSALKASQGYTERFGRQVAQTVLCTHDESCSDPCMLSITSCRLSQLRFARSFCCGPTSTVPSPPCWTGQPIHGQMPGSTALCHVRTHFKHHAWDTQMPGGCLAWRRT